MVLVGFEDIDTDLDPETAKLVKYVLEELGEYHKGRYKAITSKDLREDFEEFDGIELTDVKLRTIFGELRDRAVPIGSCQEGFYLIENMEELNDNIKSLTQRAGAIMDRVHGLKKFRRRVAKGKATF